MNLRLVVSYVVFVTTEPVIDAIIDIPSRNKPIEDRANVIKTSRVRILLQKNLPLPQTLSRTDFPDVIVVWWEDV